MKKMPSQETACDWEIERLVEELVNRVCLAEQSSPDTSPQPYHLDECYALLAEIPQPQGSPARNSRIRLTRITASPHYVVVGSECGALLLYNRRVQQPVRPMRYPHSVAVTALRLHSTASGKGERICWRWATRMGRWW